MAAEQNKEIVRRFWGEAARRGLPAALEEFLAPDFVSHPPASASPEPIRGREAWRQFSAAQFGAFPDLSVTVEDLIAEGELVAARVTARGTHAGELLALPPSGRPVRFTGIGIYRLAGGQIAEQWGEFDTLRLLQQLGALSAPGQAR